MISIALIKTVTTALVSTGSGMVIGNAVRATTPKTISGLSKILVSVGSLAIGGFVADHVSTYADKKVDEVVDAVKNIDISEEAEDQKEET